MTILFIVLCIIYIEGMVLAVLYRLNIPMEFMPNIEFVQMNRKRRLVYCFKWPWHVIKYSALHYWNWLDRDGL